MTGTFPPELIAPDHFYPFTLHRRTGHEGVTVNKQPVFFNASANIPIRIFELNCFQMEILGSTFDDSVFSEKKDRVSVSLTTYNAKVCEPEVRRKHASLIYCRTQVPREVG